ncbi:unnamed protein product [Rotaria sordida]|uniref:Rad60/SUMO-like domain-containing protein n=1 Tax=Rotaria sordida TaxID=392033 RepID=A0A814RQR7_9BILA|nr:unnamed protein product [Rotaria sordida]CAF3980871.1 unnamed protein product [Rotaria sordida]
MSVTTTTSSPSFVRTIWVQKDGRNEMRFTIQPHMKIIDDLTEALFGDNRDLYQAVFRGQILSPRAIIPDDIADEDLLELKLYKTGRQIPTDDDDDNEDRNIAWHRQVLHCYDMCWS